MVRIFLIRHGERLDHSDNSWQDTAHRVHDSPLSEKGKRQARECAASYLEPQLAKYKEPKILLLSSPLVRCVVTAREIIEALGLVKRVSMKIEEGIAEANEYLRGRMFATHRDAHEFNPITSDKRGLLTPIFLGPGDLIETAHPVKIDLRYKTLHQVKYTTKGHEILQGNTATEILPHASRTKVFIPKFLSWIREQEKSLKEEQELIIIVVSHGALSRGIAEQLVDVTIEEKFGYVTTVEVVPEEGLDSNPKFKIASQWQLEETPTTKNDSENDLDSNFA